MRTPIQSLVIALVVGSLLGGCNLSFARRSDQGYLKDTRALLESRNSAVQQCYDKALKKDAKRAGKVTVSFKVEAESGRVKDAKVVQDKTDAPLALAACVLSSIGDLVLEPGDSREGHATYTWEFQAQ